MLFSKRESNTGGLEKKYIHNEQPVQRTPEVPGPSPLKTRFPLARLRVGGGGRLFRSVGCSQPSRCAQERSTGLLDGLFPEARSLAARRAATAPASSTASAGLREIGRCLFAQRIAVSHWAAY